MQSNQSAEAFRSINNKLSQLPRTKTKRSIYRVHEELRDVKNKAYEPYIVAIGPYHHGKDNLRMMEEQKLHILQLLLECQKQNVERYISAINKLEQKARDCYAEPIGLSGAEFVEMLVLDGCFIIELARDNESPDPIFQTQWIINYLVRDLILFENQIPFFVLCELFDLIEGQNRHDVLIDNLLRFFGDSDVFPQRSEMSPPSDPKGIKHLLDLVYNKWISSGDNSCLSIERDEPTPSNGEPNLIPSATELKDANVEFRKKQGNTPFEVKFENGIMEMSPFTIQDGTECTLRNLIAYEQYFREGQSNPITDYTTLLDCLINSSRDVEILSKCKIINNWLGDSETVANIINRLGDAVVVSSDFAYDEMFAAVNGHYKKPWNKWMAMLRRDIFYSPFAYLSFFAALAILLLTVVEAVCSILQVVHK